MEQNGRLTEREADVLRLLARGRTYAQAAAELGMSAGGKRSLAEVYRAPR